MENKKILDGIWDRIVSLSSETLAILEQCPPADPSFIERMDENNARKLALIEEMRALSNQAT